MNNRTIWRPDLAELAYNYQNDQMQGFIAEKVMPLKPLDVEKGSFRSPEEAAFFNQGNMQMSRTGYPNSFTFKDSSVDYMMTPYGGSFEFSNLELSQAKQSGYGSRAEMISQNTEWMAGKAKLDYEIRTTEWFQTEANYDSGFVYDVNASSVKWSTLNTSDPLKDILTIKELLWGTPTDMIIGKQMLHKLMQHPKITSSTTVSGPKRQGLDPNVTPEYLSTYFDVPNVHVAGGIYNTAPNTPDTMTKGYIWDSNFIWIGVLDKGTKLNAKIAAWSVALGLSVDEIKTGNFLAKETVDERAGGVGMHYFDIVFYMQFLTRQKKLGALLKNAY